MRNDYWWYRYSPPLGDYNYSYYFIHPFSYVTCLFRHLKHFYQRGSRGYADCDVWSIDWHLTSYMGNALRQLAEQVHGTPIIDTGRTSYDPHLCDTLELDEWKATILYIAETFDIAAKVNDFEYLSIEEYEQAHKRFKHGMGMFTEYFFNLWD